MKNAVNLKSKSGIHRLITSLEQRGFIKNSLDTIKKKVFWETNSAVKRNGNIDAKQIIPKCPTHDFPEGITVRTHRMKDGLTSAYFHGKVTRKSYGSGNNITYFNRVGSKMIVTFPMTSQHNGNDYSYSFNGNMLKNMSLTEMAQILDYIKSELNEMYNNGN